jgi:uncharacterized protein DUF6916
MSDDDKLDEAIATVARLDRAAFRAHLDTMFVVARDADRIPLRLAEVNDGQPRRGIESFSLLFTGPVDRLLPQGLYLLEHDALGTLGIFIVPVLGSNAERILYEAVFTRQIATPGL